MKFCSACGAANPSRIVVAQGIGHRYHCGVCNVTHYQNPRVVTGCIVTWEDCVLLCRRSIDPCRGLWTLPAGYLEIGETLEQAAAREVKEEAGAIISDTRLFAVYDLPNVGEVYVLYLASLSDPTYHAGPESLDVRLFHVGDIPWHALAFTMVREALTAWTMRDRNLPCPVFSADFQHVADGALGVRQRREQR